MPSPGKSPRAWLEALLHTLAVVLLGVALYSALRQQSRGGAEERAGSAGLTAALTRWSTIAAPVAVEAGLDHPPSSLEREWLAALPGAGTATTWSGHDLVATALVLLPVADPAGGTDLLVAAPAGTQVVSGTVRLDTAGVEAGFLRLHLPTSSTDATVRSGGLSAHVVQRDSLARRRLLVLGRAGWETKFTIAALEERGWQVDIHLALAPNGDIAQGISAKAGGTAAMAQAPADHPFTAPGPMPQVRARSFAEQRARIVTAAAVVPLTPGGGIPIDTARYAAVLALDSTASRAAGRINRFVREGGGLVLWPEAASAPALQSLAAATPGDLSGEIGRHVSGTVNPDSLVIRPLLGLKPDALILESRGSQATVAARRVGAGRVVTLAHEELWRWRMAGDAHSVAAHRDWLARIVAGAALAPRRSLESAAGDAAPYAQLIDRLGPAATTSLALPAAVSGVLGWWTFVLVTGALLAEWLSRRLRSRP